MQQTPKLDQTIERYEQYVKADANNVVLWLNLGDLYHRAARFDRAIECYERCLEQNPAYAPARGRLASVLISRHRFGDAEKILRALIDGGDTDPALFHNLGLALFYQDRWAEARDCFAQAKEHNLKVPANYAYLARALHHLGLTADAIEACRAWSELSDGPDSKGYLALLEMDNGNMMRARELAAAVLAQNGEHVDANLVAGSSSVERQEMRDARTHFEIVLRQSKDNGRAWLGLGLVHLYEQEHAKAIQALDQAVRSIPDSPGIIVTLGWAHVAAKDVVVAERVFQQAIAVDRNFGESHGGLAVAYAFQRKIDLAQSEIRVATRLDPAGFGAAFAKTIILKLQGQQQAATELLARLFEQAPAAGMPTLIEQLRLYGAKQLQLGKPAAPLPKRE